MSILKVVFVIIGTLVGAGFASGQEIYLFFFSYGLKGILGILVSSLVMTFVIYKTFIILNKYNIKNYKEFLDVLIQTKNNNNYFNIKTIINIIINIFILITFFIMIAGFGAYFEQEMGINKLIGSSILAIMSAIVFFTSVKGVLKVSEYIVPILILSITIIGTENLIALNSGVQMPIIKKGWLLSSILYCSYNMILIIPTLISIRRQITKKSNIKYIVIIAGILMITMSIILFMLLIKCNVDVSTLEMPIVYIVRTFFGKFKMLYAFIILASIFTTAISIGIGFLQNICSNKKCYPQFVLFMCITSLLVSNFGFSNLVNFIYPLFGYIGILQLLLIIKQKT